MTNQTAIRHLTLVIPNLYWQHPEITLPTLNTPGLNQLLCHAQYQAIEYRISTLYAQHLWQGSLQSHAISSLGLPENTHAFFASPTHQVLGMNSLTQLAQEQINLSSDEAKSFCTQLTDFFHQDEWKFFPYQNMLWLVTSPKALSWSALPILDLPHLITENYKPQGSDAKKILQAATEVQMFMHQHKYSTINSMWFWPDLIGTATHNPLATNSPWAIHHPNRIPMPPSFLALPQDSSQVTVFDESLRLANQLIDVQKYIKNLSALDTLWFAPIFDHLNKKHLSSCQIITENATWTISRPSIIHRLLRKKTQFQGSYRD